MVADRRCLSVFLAAFPWVLVVLGTTLFFVGVYYAELTEADTANGAMRSTKRSEERDTKRRRRRLESRAAVRRRSAATAA